MGNLGLAYDKLGEYKKAIDFHQQSLAIDKRIQDNLGVIKTLGNLGNAYRSLKEYQKAIEFYQQSLVTAQKFNSRRGVGNALFNLGLTYRQLGDNKKAIDYYQKSLAIAREIQDKKLESLAYQSLANARASDSSNPEKPKADRLLNEGLRQAKTGQLKKSLVALAEALQIYRQIKDSAGEIVASISLGQSYYQLGEYQKAIELFEQGHNIAKTTENTLAVANALRNLGVVYNSMGDYQKAIDYQQQSLKISQRIADTVGVSDSLGNLGIAYYELGEYKKAIDYQEQSLAIAKKIGNKTNESATLSNLGIIYSSLGDYKRAIDLNQQALKIAKSLKDKPTERRILNSLGLAFNQLGNPQKAVEFYQQSLIIARQIGDKRGVSIALNNLGNIYNSVKDYKKAIDFYQQSLTIAKQIENRSSVGNTLTNLGSIYNSLGDYQKAIDFYQQSLTIAQEIGDISAESDVLGNLGNTYRILGEYKKAIDFYQKSLLIDQKSGNRTGEGISLNNLGLALYQSGIFPEAEKVLRQAISVLKSQRVRQQEDNYKIDIFEKQARTYRTLQKVLIAQNKSTAALEVAESGRARALVDLLASRLSVNDDTSTAPNINQIKQIAKAQNSTLVQYSIIYDYFKISGKQQYKQSELYIWVIKPTGEVTFRKADLKPLWQKENTTLAELVTTSRQSIGARGAAFRSIDVSFDPDAPKATNKLKRLQELLINPIADLLPKNPSARVTFIPQSSLFLVPFPALQDKSGKYLIEKHTILTSPSIQVLELTRQQRQQIGKQPIQGSNMLIVGNPTMPKIPPKIGETPQQLTPLPGAEKEAKAIAKLFKTQALTGNQATETKVTQRLPQARLIHLATHGLFDNVQGLNSGIALTPSPSSQNEGSDGLLTAGEILDLNLNAELVVLSACDTGRGRISGDGVIGLSRSLISAGVPSVLVSLWSVPDAPTAELMTEFYQNLQNNPDKATALRQAMLKIMKQHPNPRDWAAFTLIGEAE